MKLTSIASQPRLTGLQKREASGPSAASQTEEQVDVFSPGPGGRPSDALPKVRNLASRVATALVFGCVGVALVGCGDSQETKSLQEATTSLASKGKFAHQECKSKWGQMGPDFMPFPGFVTRCQDKPLNAKEAARLLQDGKPISYSYYSSESNTVWTDAKGNRFEVPARSDHSLKSVADALSLQNRLQNHKVDESTTKVRSK